MRFETEAKGASGKAVPVAIQAKFEDITSRHRSLVGTWTQGTVKGDFKITLDEIISPNQAYYWTFRQLILVPRSGTRCEARPSGRRPDGPQRERRGDV